MIRFNTGAWWSALLVYYGGIAPRLLYPTIIYAGYCAVAYLVCLKFQIQLDAEGFHLLAGCTTFMLVFRLNQCYARLQDAEVLIGTMMCNLRALVQSVCCYLEGCRSTHLGKPRDEEAYKEALLVKVHVVRLVLAYAVSIKFHCHVAEGMAKLGRLTKESVLHGLAVLLRMKSLLTHEESLLVEDMCGFYERELVPEGCCSSKESTYFVDFNKHRSREERKDYHSLFPGNDNGTQGGVALPPLILQLIRCALRLPLSKPWGYPERCLNFHEFLLSNVSRTFENLDHLVTIPLPLPYLQHCKILLLTFTVFYPLCINVNHGVFSNVVVPTLLAMSLVGFEMVADNFENPLGDDDCDLNVLEMIHALEVEVEAIFNLSERDAEGVFRSWRDLGHTFKLCEKAPALDSVPSSPAGNAIKSYCFTDFFEWTPLPVSTLLYLIRRSGTVHTVHSTEFSQLKSKGAVKQMLQALKSKDGYTLLLQQDGELRKQLEAIAHDVFCFKNYVRLKDFGSSYHRRATNHQLFALESADIVDKSHSFKHVVHQATPTSPKWNWEATSVSGKSNESNEAEHVSSRELVRSV